MSETSFFERHPFPVFEYLSESSRSGLLASLDSGNRSFRERRLLEFFQSLDWLPLEEIEMNPIAKLSPVLRDSVYRDIRSYFLALAQSRKESAEQRKAYKLRVFEYFRVKVPPDDKALLEGLRDFELDLTGRDLNWQHHFSPTSFKRVDLFLQSSRSEREEAIRAFKADVDAYKRNYEKLKQAALHADVCDNVFDFDAWCELRGGEDGASFHSRNKPPPKTASNGVSQLGEAMRLLELETRPEEGLTMDHVKKQFRRLTLRHHPDMPGGDQERMKRLIAAYDQLKGYLSQAI